MRLTWLVSVAVAVALAGCGGSSDNTTAAAQCLQNALANRAIGSTNNCADTTAYKVAQSGSGTKFKATCTHKVGNEYICDVTGPATESATSTNGTGIIQGGFYDVTFDGKSIVYQLASGSGTTT